MLVDYLFQDRISPRPKTAEKRVFCTCVTDGPTDEPTDGRTDQRTNGWTDRPSYRDARTQLKKGTLTHRQIHQYFHMIMTCFKFLRAHETSALRT